MGKTFEDLSGRNAEFIAEQRPFFVATAPLDAGGLINLSPKHLESFKVLNANTVACLDLTDTEVEAYQRENNLDSLDGLPGLGRD